MILGVGTDLVRVERFRSWVNDEDKVRRFFSPRECEYCLRVSADPAASLSVRFAAREAFGKALGSGMEGLKLGDIEVLRQESGQPAIILGPSAQHKVDDLAIRHGCGSVRIHLSVSHEKEYALAFVILESGG